MEKPKYGNSLRTQMLKMTLVPLMLMTLIIAAFSGSGIYQTILKNTKEELQRDANLAIFLYDSMYKGDFWTEDSDGDGVYEMYKGSERINGDYTTLDDLAQMLDIEITIFFKDMRILTSLKDVNGTRAMGTQASAVVKRDVLEEGNQEFYSNVQVYENKSFAYYEPLRDSDGNIYGMIGVCRSQEAVNDELMSHMWPIILACVLTALIIGIVMMRYNSKLGNRIHQMDGFMNTLANGDFDEEMPRVITAEDDEIKHLAIDGKRMARALKKLVEYDALTDLNNRRYAERRLEDDRIRMVETGMKFCLCISDIDFFKKVNDTYGHEMGDIILKQVSDTLREGMVGKGFAARWGGEEFLLIFENRELDLANRELNIIMENIRKIYVPHTNRQITMSFGITAMAVGETVDDTLGRADANLYEAKENGRNQIVCK